MSESHTPTDTNTDKVSKAQMLVSNLPMVDELPEDIKNGLARELERFHSNEFSASREYLSAHGRLLLAQRANAKVEWNSNNGIYCEKCNSQLNYDENPWKDEWQTRIDECRPVTDDMIDKFRLDKDKYTFCEECKYWYLNEPVTIEQHRENYMVDTFIAMTRVWGAKKKLQETREKKSEDKEDEEDKDLDNHCTCGRYISKLL